jgi:hypothetical protein
VKTKIKLEDTMKPIVIGGVSLALLGLAGTAMPVFTTEQTKDVVKIGDLKIQAQEQTSHVIPPMLSGGAILIGALMIVGGFYSRREV